jgi:hypothetical protein
MNLYVKHELKTVSALSKNLDHNKEWFCHAVRMLKHALQINNEVQADRYAKSRTAVEDTH